MNIRDLNGKTVCMLGYGREGRATVEALEKYAPESDITIADANPKIEIQNPKHWKQLGEGWLENLDKFDVLIKSPGIPPYALRPTPNALLTNSTQIFLDSINPLTTVIGVTGSKGKSTTASLIYVILQEAGKDVSLVGNIGDAAIAHIDNIGSFVVVELSSYQLMQLKRSPQIAVVTSFFPEHLDYHGSLENYKEAKKNICSHQSVDDTVFYYADSEGAKEIAETSSASKVPYTGDDSSVAIIDTKLVGTHNLFNIAAATKVARHLGINDATIIKAVQKFDGLPHRLKNIGKHSGIAWVDDAISTTPESTIAAIHALSPNVKTIILGGQDRGNDFTQLGEVISASKIDHVILMGESGSRIGNAVTGSEIIVHEASSMEEAVMIAKDTTPDGYICLLSPASPSYGMFKDFEEKGEAFTLLVSNH